MTYGVLLSLYRERPYHAERTGSHSNAEVNGLDSYGLTLPCQSLAKGSYLFLGVLRIQLHIH